MSDDLTADQLLSTSNEASRQVRNLFISFSVLLVYLSLIVGATTDVDLLLNARTQLPFLSIELPINGIFAVAPFLLFVLHTDLLMQILLLRRKLFNFQAATDVLSPRKFRERRLDSLDQFLYTQSVTGRHLPVAMRGIVAMTSQLVLFGLPLVMLLAFQLRYLPAHDISMTSWHRCLILLDCAVLAYVGISLSTHFSEDPAFSIVIPTGLLVLLAPLLSLFVLVIPGERLDLAAFRPVTRAVFGPDYADVPNHWERDQDVPPPLTQLSQLSSRLFHRNLELSGAALVAKAPSDAMLAAYVSAERPTSSAWREQVTGINLSGRDLRFANLRGARMPRANLRGADLSGANLSDADLDDAVLDGAVAVGADFGGAKMRRAILQAATLVGSDFYQADLTAANLSHANLAVATFVETELTAALLHFAQLDGVLVLNSELRGGFAASAQVRSARIEMSSLRAASFRGANLGGTQFGDGTDINKAYLLDLSDVAFQIAPPEVWNSARELIQSRLGPALLAPESKTVQRLFSRVLAAEKVKVTKLKSLEHFDDLLLDAKMLESSRLAGIELFSTIAPTLKPRKELVESLIRHLVSQGCKSRDARYGFRVRAGLDDSIDESAYLKAVSQHKCVD